MCWMSSAVQPVKSLLAADEGAVDQLVVDHLDALVAGDLGL